MFPRILSPHSSQIMWTRDGFCEIWKVEVEQQYLTLSEVWSRALLQLPQLVAFLLAQLLGMSSKSHRKCSPFGSSIWFFNSWATKKGAGFLTDHSHHWNGRHGRVESLKWRPGITQGFLLILTGSSWSLFAPLHILLPLAGATIPPSPRLSISSHSCAESNPYNKSLSRSLWKFCWYDQIWQMHKQNQLPL